MGRDVSRAINNVYYLARLNAAQENERLKSRESASEELGMSVSSLADIELGLYKYLPADKVVRMADLYNAPWIEGYYCNHECVLKNRGKMCDREVSLERATVNMCKNIRADKIEKFKADWLDFVVEEGADPEIKAKKMNELYDTLEKYEEMISEMKTVLLVEINEGKRCTK